MADNEKSQNSGGSEADVETDEFETDNEDWEKLGSHANPELLALIGHEDDDISNLPTSVKRRIKALEKLQYECNKLEAEFYKEVHALECKYMTLYEPLYKKRMEIVNGIYEPTDEECNFPSFLDEEEKLEEMDNVMNENIQLDIENKSDMKGIQHFWLTALKNADLLADMIQPHDEPALESLKDIVVKMSESNPMAFTLEFHFDENPYFSNTILKKQYEMVCEVNEKDPFFDGPEIVRCRGCKILWKDGQNLTVKTVRKTQRHKKNGHVRVITQCVPVESFFNFFVVRESIVSQNGSYLSKTVDDLLYADFEIGHFIRERFIPRAVLYFTGEASDEEDGDEMFDLEEEEEEEEYDEAGDHFRVDNDV